MRNIQKGPEPPTLTQHRQTPHADYRNFDDKDALRQSLVREQGGLCCYCLSRIRPTSAEMKIEHWQCQEHFPGRQLDYRNLLGACIGGEGRPGKEQHCDTRKGSNALSINPADPACNVERLIKFPGTGKIKSDDPDIDCQLNEVLNLNHPQLVSNRKATLDSFCRALGKSPRNNGWFQKTLKKWRGEGGNELEPFNQVIVYYLCRKLNIAL
jgi:uncharacterized protein (TIGR02646 family)